MSLWNIHVSAWNNHLFLAQVEVIYHLLVIGETLYQKRMSSLDLAAQWLEYNKEIWNSMKDSLFILHQRFSASRLLA